MSTITDLKSTTLNPCLKAVLFLVIAATVEHLQAATWQSVAPSNPPIGNPLKGFVCYAEDYDDFPYSLEYEPLPVNAIQTGYESFDWAALENVLSTIASRGHQALLKFYYDNPAKPSGIPEFLSHVPVNPYSTYQETTPEESRSVSPDYEHHDLKRSMLSFIAAFGARYDGDPRIGFIELGLIGFWGEWHTYPYSEWMPTINTQNAVMEAYDNAFDLTCILVREPRGNSPAYNIGYHDDSFVHSTYDNLPPDTDWYHYPKLVSANEINKWQTCPMGGELRPELQETLWNDPSCSYTHPTEQHIQTWNEAVGLTHASWMLVSHAFWPGYSGDAKTRALEGSRKLGYALQIDSWMAETDPDTGTTPISVKIKNVGVAPFYYKWDLELGLFSMGSEPIILPTDWDIRSVIDSNPVTFIYQGDIGDLPDGTITLAVRMKNPLPNGDPVVFANANPDPPAPGWQRIGTYNRTPVISPIANHSVSAGQTIQIKVTATDLDGNTPAFSATSE